MSVTTEPARGLRVAELADAVGLSPDTIRYYERAGLLPPPTRTPSGYRTYDEAATDRLKFIRGAQRLGLRLRDIIDLLAARDTELHTGTLNPQGCRSLAPGRRRIAEKPPRGAIGDG